jgi:GNAT superfamily N-acetyltransferase
MNQQNEAEVRCHGGDEILFRRLDPPVASWTKAGNRWVVEYWRENMAYPIAQAWVVVDYAPYIDWLHVMEGYRRLGYGSELLKAIIERWPDVEFDSSTDVGEQFLAGHEEKSSGEEALG